MSPAPHALLLTDVVDSTKLSEQLGDVAMAKVWAAHDRVARDLLVPHRGREIDKTDGFLLLFDDAADAVAYAVAYHRAIATLDPPLSARAGLHVGPVILTENAPADVARGAKPLELDGLAKPMAARVMGLASGGQTLATAAAIAALGATPLRVESHGHWRMKGVSEPVELFEVGEDGAPFTPPPDGAKVYRVVRSDRHWIPAREVPHSLPAERDAFVGRGADLVDLARRLDDGARLVTLLGIGGTGKTRLVTHYGWTWLGDWPGGVWFCDLSEARGPDGVVGAVARGLDAPLGAGDPVSLVGHAIASRGRCLVILDNFEQVARFAEETLGRWLDRAREAAFVVTSREVLGLSGETSIALAPLVPDESVDLFVTRATQAKRDFVLVDADRPAVDALVRLLDGLPLAIELAAARVRMMPPAMVLSRMNDRFKLLASSGGRHTRQATLRGALDWSWDLLSADEQAALAQLSVFEGGFTLEAAEGVLALADAWPMDAVQALVDKSLVRTTGGADAASARLDLLVTVQEYAREKLEAAGAREEAEDRHAAWFARYGAPEALGGTMAHSGTARRKVLAREVDNLAVACRRATARGDGQRAVALFRAAWDVLQFSGPISVGVALGEPVLALPGVAPADRAAAGLALARAYEVVGRYDEAREIYVSALAHYREVGDRRLEGRVLAILGNVYRVLHRLDDAREVLEAALALHRAGSDRNVEGIALSTLALVNRQQQRWEEALTQLEAALGAFREVGNIHSEAVTHSNLALVSQAVGRTSEAVAHNEAALAANRAVGDRYLDCLIHTHLGHLAIVQDRPANAANHYATALNLQRALGNRRAEGATHAGLASAAAALGQVDEARAQNDLALALAREFGDRHLEGIVRGNLGQVEARHGRWAEAVAHLEAALPIHREVGNHRSEGVVIGVLGEAHLRHGRLSEARACLAEAERLLSADDVRRKLAKVLCARARLEAAEGDLTAARVTYVEALGLAEGAPPESHLGRDLREAADAVGVDP